MKILQIESSVISWDSLFFNFSYKGFVIYNYFRLMVNRMNFTKKCPFPLLLPIDTRNYNQIISSALIVI